MRTLILVFLLSLIAITTQEPLRGQYRDDSFEDDPSISFNTPAEVGTNIHTDVINTVFNSKFVKEQVKSALEFADFNIRALKLGTSLLSRENFFLLGRALKYFNKISELFITYVLPDDPNGPGIFQNIFPNLPIDETLYGSENDEAEEFDAVNKIRYSRAAAQASGAEREDVEEAEKTLKRMEEQFYRMFNIS